MHFKHPAVQTACMFAGETLCLIPYFIGQWMKGDTSRTYSVDGVSSGSKVALLRKTAFAFSLPALCDAAATTLLNLGLYYTYASVFQMLRGTLVVFAGILTITMLKRRLRSHNWLGIVLITAGAALVGASSIVYDKEDAAAEGSHHRAASNPLLGDLLVILAQLLNALQFIIEEKYLRQIHPPVLLAVGTEGAVGLILSAIALPLLSYIHGPGGMPIDDASAAIKSIATSLTLQWTTVATVLSIAAFNFCGVSVTKRLSGTSRAAIDACRTAVVWLFCLKVGWERFHMLQVVGFTILITGTSVYNDILRSWMPAPAELRASIRERQRLADGHGQHHHRNGGTGSRHPHHETHPSGGRQRGGLEEPLLNGEATSRSRSSSQGDLEALNAQQHQGMAAAGSPEMPEVHVITPEAILKESGATGSRSQAGNLPPRPSFTFAPVHSQAMATGNRHRSMTMARSVSIMPGVLSPHSLASVPSSDLLYLNSVRSGGLGESYYTSGLSSESEGYSSESEEETTHEGNGNGNSQTQRQYNENEGDLSEPRMSSEQQQQPRDQQ